MATRYWAGGTGNWSDTAHWSASPTGTPTGASVPIATDDVVFNANSGLVGFICTVDTAQTCATLTLTPGSGAGVSTITITASLTVTGAFSMSGTAGNQRFLIRGTTYGLATDFSVGSSSGLSDVDFRDVRVIGAAAPLSGTRIGDLRGVTGVTFNATKTVYWVTAGGGNWSGNNWSDATGNPASTNYFPLAQDTATFAVAGLTSGSTVTMDAAIPYTGTVDMSLRTTASSALITLATTAFTIYGDWKNGSGTTLSGTAALTYSGRNTQSITSAGKTFTQALTVDTYGGTVQLVDLLNIGTTTLTVTNGTFTTNGQNVTAATLSSSNSNVRTINLGASVLALSGSAPITFTNSTTMTFNAGTSTINCTSTVAVTVNGGGLSFNNLSFTGTTAVTHVMNGANTFVNLTFTAPAATGLMQCTFFANQTITDTLTCAGASAIRRIFLRSNTIGTQRTLTCAAVSGQDSDFRDIAIAGAAAPYNAGSLRVGNCGGNSGITFPAGVPKYWNLAGNVNWSATGWATTSGGAPAANNFPLAQDTATFNTASGTIGTITIDAAWNIGTVDMTGRVVTTFQMTLTTSTNAPTVYGSWLFDTGVSSTSTTGTITFGGRTTQTITSRGITFGCPIAVNSATGTVQLADALTLGSTRTLTLTTGTFDAVTFSVSVGLATLSGGTLKMGSSTWTLLGTGTVWNFTSSTLFKGTANIALSDTSATARTFAGGFQSYNKLTIGGATGTSTLTITSNNQFTEIASTKTVAHTIALGTTTQTFGAWTVTGTVGNVVTVTGTATLTIAGARVSGVDYLAMGTTAISTTSPGEFYAGANSTGTGAGVILTAAPAAVTRYWCGGTGTWDAATTTNWAATSGGAGPASVPTSADAVVFDTLSNATAYTVTCTATQLRCASLTMAGPAVGNVTWAGTAPLAIHGNVTLPATGMTRTYTGSITLTGSATGKTFTTNGVALASAVTVNGVGCGWTLGSAATLGGAFIVTHGSFNTGNFALSCINLSSSNSNTRSLTFGTSTISASAAFTLTTTTNLTFSAVSSTINASTSTSTIDLGGFSFGTFNFTSTSSGSITINGANTFANLSIAGKTSAAVANFAFSSNQTISGTLTISAGTNAAMRNFLQSDTIGTTRTLTCGSISAQDADFRDITIAGAAAPYNASSLRIGDCKGNSGITFPAAKTVYWGYASSDSFGVSPGLWSSTAPLSFTGSRSGTTLTTTGSPALTIGMAVWAGASPLGTITAGSGNTWTTSLSGTVTSQTLVAVTLASANFPLAQDIIVFSSALPLTATIATINAPYNLGTIDMSARTTNTMTLTFGGGTGTTVYGNWTNGAGVTITGIANLIFAGRTTQTITSAGCIFSVYLNINSPSGTVMLLDGFSSSGGGSFQLIAGTLDTNGYSFTLTGAGGAVDITNGSGGTYVNMGGSVWSIAASGTTFGNFDNIPFAGPGTISLTGATAKTFYGGNNNYSSITLNQGGAGTLTISGSNTFNDITNTYGATGATTIDFDISTTVSQFTATGTVGKLLTISGTSVTLPATLILTSGTVNSNYLAVNNIRAYATTSTWYAGNSTNGGTLGWIFPAAPVTAYTRSFGWIIT